MKVSLSLEALEVLEDKLGKEGAKAFIKSIDEIISGITELKWKTSKEELLNAIREEFINENIFEERTNSMEERINSPLLKNNGFGEGLFAMSFFAHANLTSPSACHRIYPFYRATFLFFSSFPFSFSLLLLPLSFSFSFFFLFFFPFSFLPSFNILIAILDGARKGIINSYQHFY
jgi:5-hydroxyisourate hydrolase-like protein (transthyretin family)